jgi:hypothetical protein
MPAVDAQYTPSSATAILDALQRAGFADTSFKIIYHFGPEATIQAYYDYCRERVIDFRKDGTNERVYKRLALIQNAFAAGGFSRPAKPGVFEALATAARLEIPIE